ncbi:MAG: hypothetical protein U0470_02325 [Anaerolineae bacterium]
MPKLTEPYATFPVAAAVLAAIALAALLGACRRTPTPPALPRPRRRCAPAAWPPGAASSSARSRRPACG